MKFDEKGLIPAIVQHVRSGEVLMLGYMNEVALQHTVETGLVTFWSRSRDELWQKGETSGNILHLVEIRQDCDGDALLVLAEPAGPTCHTGAVTCFHKSLDDTKIDVPRPTSAIIAHLIDLIQQRSVECPEGSYTTKLLTGGVDRIGKKIGEEAAEVIIAAKNESKDELSWELSDLFYHSMVLLVQQGVSEQALWNELWRRHGERRPEQS
ncbi:MAG: bifunctional phosphoribosyl-AMP cyclohydrolase/phosphoribosyl-ATP diphosphatase HisIE [Chloroflexota bacterium]